MAMEHTLTLVKLLFEMRGVPEDVVEDIREAILSFFILEIGLLGLGLLGHL